MTGPDLTIVNWLLAASPGVLLIVAILALNWSAPRAGAAAWLLARALALLVFGAARDHISIATAKGLSLAVFVLTIVWASVYMFNMVDKLKGISIGYLYAKFLEWSSDLSDDERRALFHGTAIEAYGAFPGS